jgi:SAM-dependent methyltransferase
MSQSFQVEVAVRSRYSAAAQTRVEALCCPVQYDDRYLKVIPKEILERDYGCGDPSKYLVSGETVLDLGSGGGKICFIASQIVGPQGRVIGVDMNDEMLSLARAHQQRVGDAIGWHNIEFRRGRIQDLALDLDLLDAELRGNPIQGASAFLAAQGLADRLRAERPLVADASVDVVVSNCVLNLVNAREKGTLFQELFRVLKPGGRAVISDIVAEQPVPPALQKDPELWSGCISGALTESGFLEAFEVAGFHGLELVKRDAVPWRVVEGIAFRSVTVRAYRPVGAPPGSTEGRRVIYRGPFREVVDDMGTRYERGKARAVGAEVYERCRRAPLDRSFECLPAPDGSGPESGGCCADEPCC